jgi:serine/threonine-protein kinase
VQQSPGSKIPLIIGAGLATLLGASAGLYLFTNKARPPLPPIEAYSQPIQPPESPAPPGPSVAPGPSVDQTLPPPSVKRVKLVVAPRDVIVEIDGKEVPVTNGVAEVEGALGSIHRVRVSKGSSEMLADVIVAEFGASPPMVELLAKTTTPKPVVTAAAPQPAPSPSPALPGIKRDFE